MDTLFRCIEEGTAPGRVVDFAKNYLRQEGFEELYYDRLFSPKVEGRYFIAPFSDVLIAFTMGHKRAYMQNLRMAFAHVDQPCFKIKGNPDYTNMGCAQLNVEVYGGMMDHTWFDRPLGMAGTVALKGEDIFHPHMVSFDSRSPVAVIPGLAIHMNREANNGWKIDRQKEMMPVTGLAGGTWTRTGFLTYLGKELNVDVSEILSWDINLYNCDAPALVGFDKELLCAPRIDNLASVSALLEALTEGERDDGINLIGLFNHEEVGSVSKSGANSELLTYVLRALFEALGCSDEIFRASLAGSIYLSVDGAHAAHPNYPDKCDTTTRAYIGQGPAIKISNSRKYASDCQAQAVLKGIAEKYEVALQSIADRNTIRGGSTIGPMIQAWLPMAGGDVGIPMWAMHSARETMAAADYQALCQLVTAFFLE